MIFNQTGGGAALNFKIVGGTAAPASPKENTIWVNTATDITSYIFSASSPTEPVEGMVWIQIDKKSNISFSITKKNPIIVYPVAAQQYVSGEWLNVTVQVYQNGAWSSLWDGVTLYDSGNAYEYITGGYEAVGTATLTLDSTYMSVTGSTQGGMYAGDPIDLTGFSYVRFDWTSRAGGIDKRFVVSKTKATGYGSVASSVLETGYEGERKTTDVPVPGDGEYYIGAGRFASGTATAFDIHNITLVR